MRTLTAVIALVAMCLTALPAVAQTAEKKTEGKTVLTVGEAVIYGNDEAAAKEKAIEHALRMAVEQVVGTVIQSNTLVENYVTIDDSILSQSKGYVETYKLIEAKVESGVMMVKVEATVKEAKLKGDLDELRAAFNRKGYPRVMLMIAEQNIGESSFSQWWGNTTSVISMGQVENTLIDELGNRGFPFVDAQVLAGKLQQNDAYKVVSGQVSNQAAREIANLTDAEVVLVGSAVAVDAGTILGTKMHSGQADITVRAINTDNGEILFSSSVHGTSQHVVPQTAGKGALVAAAKKLADDITAKITKKWLQSVSTVSLEVSGVTDYQMLDDFKKALAHQVRGVTGVQMRRLLKTQATFDVFLRGKTELFARELAQKSFEGFVVRVDEQSPNKLKVTLIKQ